jgi:hypothetical protein
MKLGSILLTQALVVLFVGTLWVLNVVKLTESDFKAPFKKEIVHAIGLVPPACIVTGWLNIADEPYSR